MITIGLSFSFTITKLGKDNIAIMKKYRYELIVLGVLLLLYLVVSFDKSYSQFDLIEQSLTDELNKIPPVSRAVEVNRDIMKEEDREILITTKYKTNLSYSEIKNYYNRILNENGWVNIKEEKILYWGNDLGGKLISYSKGDYVATLHYAGEKSDYSWVYAFSMEWNIRFSGDKSKSVPGT